VLSHSSIKEKSMSAWTSVTGCLYFNKDFSFAIESLPFNSDIDYRKLIIKQFDDFFEKYIDGSDIQYNINDNGIYYIIDFNCNLKDFSNVKPIEQWLKSITNNKKLVLIELLIYVITDNIGIHKRQHIYYLDYIDRKLKKAKL
jgi:hypothetical protein